MRLVDQRRPRWYCGAGLFAVLWSGTALSADDEIVRIEIPHYGISIVHMESLPKPAVEEIAAQTYTAMRRVTAWLEQAESYSGSRLDSRGPLRVIIDPDKRTPAQMRGTIFVPESRVRLAYEAGQLADGDFGLVHEVTHVLAVSAYRKDRNRFFDDGLAVFLQQKFGPTGNYPALGSDLHVAVAELSERYGALIPLDDADQARRESGDRRRLGYLQLGSFTQFLVENFGVEAYMRIYQGEELAGVTGLSMHELEARWQRLINSI